MRSLRLVLVGSAAYAALFALVTWQALRGQPLIHPDCATLTAAALIAGATAAETCAALRTPAGPATPSTTEIEVAA